MNENRSILKFYENRPEYELVIKSVYPLEAFYLTKSLTRIFDVINNTIQEKDLKSQPMDESITKIVDCFSKLVFLFPPHCLLLKRGGSID